MQKQWMVQRQLWNGEVIAGTGMPIVILHGWGRTHREWVAAGKHLHRVSGRTIYCLDLPGFGGSTLPKVEDVEEYVKLLVQWLDYEQINRASFVGHSLGGRVGIILSAKYQAKIEKLVLVDSAGVRQWSMKRLILTSVARMFGWIPEELRRRMVTGFMDEDYRSSPTLRDLYRAVVKSDLTDYLSEIKAPTTVIWGERDPILPLSLTKKYSAMVHDCRIRVVWEAGHDPHLTHPRELIRVLEEVWT